MIRCVVVHNPAPQNLNDLSAASKTVECHASAGNKLT